MTTEHSQETKIAVLEAKVDHMMGHVKELTLRVRANEKVVASVSLLGVIACTIIGAGYFAPKAESAPTAGEWIQDMREWKSKQGREPIENSIDDSLLDWGIYYENYENKDFDDMEHDCPEHTEQEE